jgi:DnaJ family protein C protein 2
VPTLGDDTTDIDTVYAFYDFWHKFDSWRVFLHDSEHDVDTAEHRDHKRWMAKKNEAAAKKKKKAEYTRLANLVDRAQAADPRIRRVKQEAKDKKEREKREKEEAIQRALDEEKRVAEEAERLAREKEESEKNERQNAKMQKEKQKKLFRKIKKSFRELMAAFEAQGVAGAIDVVKTEEICDGVEMDVLQKLVDACGGSTDKLNAAGLEAVAATLAKL